MRKIELKAKILMITFALFILAGGGSLFALATTVTQKPKTEKMIDAESLVYADTRKITATQGASIDKSLEGQWQLIETDGNKTNLGEHAIVAQANSLLILGGGYQVFEDQTVKRLPEFVEVEMNEEAFFKLADRRYLFVSPTISVKEQEDVSFEKYLVILLDKAGNGQLFNQVKTIKTTKEIELAGTKYSFEVSKEILWANEVQADMKRIFGTTNTFLANNNDDQDLLNPDDDYDNPEVIDLTIKGGDGGKGGKGGNGGVGGIGGIGGNGGTGIAGGISGGNGSVQEARKSMNFKTVEAGIDQLVINYSVIDPLAQYGVTWLRVYDPKASNKLVQQINIDPMGETIQVLNLTPDTQYTLSLGYTSVDSEEDDNYVEQDALKIGTRMATASINLVQQDVQYLTFNVKLNKDYLPDILQLKLLDAKTGDDLTGSVYDVNISQAAEESGYTFKIEFDRTNSETLKLAVFAASKEGVSINYGGYATFYNKLYK